MTHHMPGTALSTSFLLSYSKNCWYFIVSFCNPHILDDEIKKLIQGTQLNS